MNSPEPPRPATPFQQLRQGFQALLGLPADAQEAALAALDRDDPPLAMRLRGLLRQAAQAPEPCVVAPSAAPLAGGERIGPYAVINVLAQGGMGVVYRAARADGAYAQQVALKLMAPGLRDSAGLRLRFLRERQILARLEHPAIVRLLDGGVSDDGRLWLALELVDGVELLGWVRSQQPDRNQRLRLFIDLCAAVEHAHARQVLHRDLKPANVLVDGEARPRLLDFGIAGLLDDTGEGTARATRSMAMTVRYAAPEQVRQQHGTVATDVYALGVLLHELLTGGASPYPQAQAGTQTWASAVLDARPQPLRHAVAATGDAAVAVDAELEAIVLHALAKEPAQRYPNVSALRADLEDWLTGRPARSGVGGAAAQWRAQLKRWRWPLAATGAVLLALAIGTAWALREARHAREQAALAQANHQVLLQLLTSASPADFVGREPTASAFLVAAATQVDQRLAERPQAVWPALGEIANGLLNLGRSRDAETVLQRALAAIGRDPEASQDDQLMLWKLLAFAQSNTEARPRSAATLARISALANDQSVASGERADTLATAAGLAARHGDSAACSRLLAQLDIALRDAAQWPPAVRERIQRQRGLALLRADQPVPALAALAEAQAAIDAQPTEFSALRAAELRTFTAAARLAAGQAKGAAADLAAALPVLEREYGVDHPERGALALLEAELALAQHRTTHARERLEFAAGRIDADSDLLASLRRLQLAWALDAGDCAAAAAVTLPQTPPDARQQHAAASLAARLADQCPHP